MYCPQCGSKIAAQDKACSRCGKMVSAPVSAGRKGMQWKEVLPWKEILPWTVFAVLTLTVLLMVYFVGASVQTASRILQLESSDLHAEEHTLSPAQLESIGTYGAPQAFTILFYTEEVEGGSLATFRHESWTYYSAGVELTFLNGDLIEEAQLSFTSTTLQSMPYRPEQFRPFMTLEEITAAIGSQEVLEVPVEPEIARGGKVYYAGQLSFALAQGELVYIEVVPVEDAGG